MLELIFSLVIIIFLDQIYRFSNFCSPGNLDPEVDEKLLYDTFSAFGVILTTPKIQRDPETGNSKGFAFINYASFEASDAAIEAMNGEDREKFLSF